jgi:hypothetical protein
MNIISDLKYFLGKYIESKYTCQIPYEIVHNKFKYKDIYFEFPDIMNIKCAIPYEIIKKDRNYIYNVIDEGIAKLKNHYNIENYNWIGFFDLRIYQSLYYDAIELKIYSNIINIDKYIKTEDFNNKLEDILNEE